MYVCMCMYVSSSVRFQDSPLPFLFAWSNEPNGNICRDGGTWRGRSDMIYDCLINTEPLKYFPPPPPIPPESPH